MHNGENCSVPFLEEIDAGYPVWKDLDIRKIPKAKNPTDITKKTHIPRVLGCSRLCVLNPIVSVWRTDRISFCSALWISLCT